MKNVEVHKSGNFTVISNNVLQNKNLSCKAKGLLCFMLSLPKEWDYSIKGLECVLFEGKFAITNILNELIEKRYVIRTKVKNKHGCFKGYNYDIFEKPQFENPYPDNPYPGNPYPGNPYPGNPYPGNPYTGNPYTGNQPQINKYKKINNKKINTEKINTEKKAYGGKSTLGDLISPPLKIHDLIDFYFHTGIHSKFIYDENISNFGLENIKRYCEKNKCNINQENFQDYKKYAINSYKRAKEKIGLI